MSETPRCSTTNLDYKRDPLLVEREKTHGSFHDNATLSCAFVDAIPQAAFNKLNSVQRVVLGMIFLKIARAVSNPNVKDHWDDIAGYAKLGSEACE